MIKIDNKEHCTGCAMCANLCPVDAIVMTSDIEGYLYPQVNEKKCTNCGLCERRCPKKNYSVKKIELDRAYAAYNKNEEIRKISSSGGMFSLFAESILGTGGIVFGAAYDKDFHVHHISVESVDDLPMIIGSKYIQSELRGIYKEVKTALSIKRKVLFVGTNCQIEGLLSFLGNTNLDNLFCIDVICLGVPSAKVWDSYKKFFLPSDKLIALNFKDKKYGWNRFHIHLTFSKTEKYIRGFYSEYMQTFFRRYNMRPSCYTCQFKTKNRKSDITLADCWGINEFAKELNDNRGCSSVIVHSEKGQRLFNAIEDSIVYCEVPVEKVIEGNPNYCIPAKRPLGRDIFWRGMEFFPRGTLLIFGNSFALKFKEKVKKIIRR